MPLYAYEVTYEQYSPFPPVSTLPTVYAVSPLQVAERLARMGRLPEGAGTFWVRVVTEAHDNGMPAKVISLPVLAYDAEAYGTPVPASPAPASPPP